MTIGHRADGQCRAPGVKILNDGWTVVTQDGSLSAHFEHTVLITEGEPEILTCPEKCLRS
jgi:methionyl aminopeptidase